jgi:hypothetical protein
MVRPNARYHWVSVVASDYPAMLLPWGKSRNPLPTFPVSSANVPISVSAGGSYGSWASGSVDGS